LVLFIRLNHAHTLLKFEDGFNTGLSIRQFAPPGWEEGHSQFDIGSSGDYGYRMSREYVLQPFRAPIHLQIEYARELNEQQYAAVTAPPGPSLVIAGAGSGKTRTLIYRVAYLLEQGIPPERMLLLTFTNKAAKEMMRRVADLLGQELASLWGGTFHAIGNRVLRQHAKLLGYESDFTLLDREDQKDLLNACIDDAKTTVRLNQLRTMDKSRLIKRLGKVSAATMAAVDTAIKISLGLIEV
jgi:hypothetical protein